MSEWPLMAFTILLEFACGSALASTLIECLMRRSDLAPLRPLGLSVFPLAALALLASLLHLGRPFYAWRAFSNLGSSRLSLEVLLCALFVLSAFLYSSLWWAGRAESRTAAGFVTCVLGIAAVISSSAVYLIPAQPAWNSGWVPCSLVGAVFVFGGLLPLLLPARMEGAPSKLLLGAGMAGGLAVLASVAWMLARMAQLPADEFVAAGLREGLRALSSGYGIRLGMHVVLAGFLPVVAAIRSWHATDLHGPGLLERRLVFLGATIGIVIGRALMFSLASIQNRTLPD